MAVRRDAMLLLAACCLAGTYLAAAHVGPRPGEIYMAPPHGGAKPGENGITTGYVCQPAGSGQVAWTISDGWRTVVSNGLPRFAVYDYCPFGGGGWFCGTYKHCPTGRWGEKGELCFPPNWGYPNWYENATVDTGADWGGAPADGSTSCNMGALGDWSNVTCPVTKAGAQEGHFDCSLPLNQTYTLKLYPLPTDQTTGPAVVSQQCGVALDGVPLLNSLEAGQHTLLQASVVQDRCGGHPTPGQTGASYHYHNLPLCTNEGNTATEPTPYDEGPSQHSPLLAFAMDGFGIYGFQDAHGSGKRCKVKCQGTQCKDSCDRKNGEKCHCGDGYWTGDPYCMDKAQGRCERFPVVDGCGGHFGPIPGNGSVYNYHYHGRRKPPYTLGCYGPSWGKCEQIYAATNGSVTGACHDECPKANLVGGMCVASGFQNWFNPKDVVFGTRYLTATNQNLGRRRA